MAFELIYSREEHVFIYGTRSSHITGGSQNVVIMNLTAVDITTSSVLLNWTEPNGQISRCLVEYEDNNLIAENTSIM